MIKIQVRWTFLVAAATVAFCLSGVEPARAENKASQPTIQLKVRETPKTFTLDELRKRLTVQTLTVQDPVYKTKKTYEGFWLSDLLQLGAGQARADTPIGDEIQFTSADGYSPTLVFSKLGTQKALVAFREKGRKDRWQKFQQGKQWMTPAPFYLVWDTQDEGFPWPYQLVAIELIRFSMKYDRLFPADVERTSSTYRGFELFKGQCLKCHSINLQGGELGPELNLPKNITEYRDESFLRAFVRNPTEFRLKSKMPAFPTLTDSQITDIVTYLRWAKSNKKQP